MASGSEREAVKLVAKRLSALTRAQVQSRVHVASGYVCVQGKSGVFKAQSLTRSFDIVCRSWTCIIGICGGSVRQLLFIAIFVGPSFPLYFLGYVSNVGRKGHSSLSAPVPAEGFGF